MSSDNGSTRKGVPFTLVRDENDDLHTSTAAVRLDPERVVSARRSAISELFESWRATTKDREQKYARRYQWIQARMAPLVFGTTAFTAFAMLALFTVGGWYLVQAIQAGFKGPSDRKFEVMTAGLHALEILILAPLPYLLLLGLGRYVETLAHGKDAKRAKAELLDFKAFEVALLIAIIAAFVIGMLFDEDTRFNWTVIGPISVFVAVLVGYFALLEYLGRITDHDFEKNPKDFYRLLASAEQAKSEGKYQVAAGFYREAAHYALSNNGEESKRTWRAMANSALCSYFDAKDRIRGETAMNAAKHTMRESIEELCLQDDFGYIELIVNLASDLKITRDELGIRPKAELDAIKNEIQARLKAKDEDTNAQRKTFSEQLLDKLTP